MTTEISVEFTRLLARFEAELEILSDKPEESVEGALRALWFTAAGDARSVEAVLEEPELPELGTTECEVLEELVEARLEGTPLAHLTRRQRFMGVDMLSSPEALIPRKETEILGGAALEHLRACCDERGEAVVVDACTGSGNLALALAWNEPRCRVYGTDLSEEAVALASENAEYLGLSSRVDFRAGDLFAPLEEEWWGRIDLLTCNPPYISSAKIETLAEEISRHEPHLAFDGGPFGVAILARLIGEAPRLLKAESWLCFELGLGQGLSMKKRLEKMESFEDVRIYEDAEGEIRALAARTP